MIRRFIFIPPNSKLFLPAPAGVPQILPAVHSLPPSGSQLFGVQDPLIGLLRQEPHAPLNIRPGGQVQLPKAEALIRPGVALKDLDKAARDHIAAAGYGEYFTHRLGHFIGQTEHEKGDVSATNTTLAKPGMIFSIEPGVYLPGEFGVRVEDLVLVTEDGCEILNHVDKHWRTVG